MGLKKKLVILVKDYARNHEGFRKWARETRTKYLYREFRKGADRIRTDRKLVYLNSFNGRSYSDAPKAMYEYMLRDDRYSGFRFVWMFREPEKYRWLEQNRDTKVVGFNSREEVETLREAGYWITNYRMLEQYVPKEDQTYVECWHGTPFKRLGYDMMASDNAMNSLEEIFQKYDRDTVRMKYILSQSPFATRVFTSAWNLKKFGKEDCVIEEGYPRNDILLNADDSYIRALKEKMGLDPASIGNRKILLYAPTWRDNQFDRSMGTYAFHSDVNYDILQKELGEDYVILFRVHYLAARAFDFDKYKGFIYNVSDHDDINDLYLMADMLITDYSSSFFDYANLKRPMVFYMYDLEDYRDSVRGLYFSPDILPGPIVRTEKELADAVRDQSEHFVFDEKYRAFNEKFNALDDGHATERVLARIFNESEEQF